MPATEVTHRARNTKASSALNTVILCSSRIELNPMKVQRVKKATAGRGIRGNAVDTNRSERSALGRVNQNPFAADRCSANTNAALLLSRHPLSVEVTIADTGGLVDDFDVEILANPPFDGI